MISANYAKAIFVFQVAITGDQPSLNRIQKRKTIDIENEGTKLRK